MTAPFSKIYTDYIVVAISLVPIFADIFFGGVGTIELIVAWLMSGAFAWFIFEIIDAHRLGSFERSHTMPIAWSLLALLTNFNQHIYSGGNSLFALLPMLGFLVVVYTVLHTWQNRMSPIEYIISGIAIGVLSTINSYWLIYILLFPVIFYMLRSWSTRNLASLILGILIPIWFTYCFRLFVFGSPNADGFLISYGDIINSFYPTYIVYSFTSWTFFAIIILLLIIYSVVGLSLDVASTVKANWGIVMISVLGLIYAICALIDYTHLPKHLGILSVLLSLLVCINHSHFKSALHDWWIISIIITMIVLDLVPHFSELWEFMDVPGIMGQASTYFAQFSFSNIF